MTTSTARVPAVSITITRAEGPTDLCGRPQTFVTDEAGDCWSAARAWLHGQIDSFNDASSHEHDFEVVFADGEVYRGKLECKARPGVAGDLDVAAHMLGALRFYVGEQRPERYTEQQYLAFINRNPEVPQRARAFLATYEIPA